MKKALPYVSDGNNKWQDRHISVSKEMEKKVDDIFRAATAGSPKEHPTTRVSVGVEARKSSRGKLSIYWQPHNFRVYFDFDRLLFTPKKKGNRPLKSVEGSVPFFRSDYVHSIKNYGSEHFYSGFMGGSITVKKNQVLVRNHMHRKQWREIKADNWQDFLEQMRSVRKELMDHAKTMLQVFVRLHGGRTAYDVLLVKSEDKVAGDEVLDGLPPNMVIHAAPVFKKVYRDSVEFYGEAHVRNYIHNRAIEDIAPEIVKEIGKLKESILSLASLDVPVVDWLFSSPERMDTFNAMSVTDKNSVLFDGYRF